MVEFHDIPGTLNLDSHIRDYKPGNMVSALMDQAFLKKDGGITREGLALFYHLNSDIQNIHLIHPGDRVKLPKPSILAQPWHHLITGPVQTTMAPPFFRPCH